jgi:hypothetical protein
MTTNDNTGNEEKSRMRNGVLNLFKIWKQITKPIHYNVVSLPGESFKFELETLKLEKKTEFLFLQMYEKLAEVFNRLKNNPIFEVAAQGEGFTMYKNESLPPVTAFANAPTFAWYDLCGNPTPKNVELFSDKVAKNSVIVITFANLFRRPEGLDKSVVAFGAVNYMKFKLSEMTFLFSEEYKSKTQGTPMVMMAFTNSLPLAAALKGLGLRKGSFLKLLEGKSTIRDIEINETKQSPTFKKVKALIDQGSSNESIMSELTLSKMELAGYKAARTSELRRGSGNTKTTAKRKAPAPSAEERIERLEKQRKYYSANQKQVKARCKSYYAANKEKIKAQARLYYNNNKKKINKRVKAKADLYKKLFAAQAKAFITDKRMKHTKTGSCQ